MEKTGRRRSGRRAALAIALVIAVYGVWAVRRPVPPVPVLQPEVKTTVTVPAGALAWPAGGQAAVGIAGSSVLEIHGKQAGAPTASTAKLITALTVLQKKPLTLGQQGPNITLSANDVAIYNAYAAQQGSVVKVQAGEQISEYQMLQTIMLPSANNMADSLAIWAFGSLPAYATAANEYVAGLGLTSTRIGSDASGLAPSSVSSAHDLVRLGEIAMQNPVLSQIVGQSTTTGIPIVKDIKNVNFLLGTAGIVGVKTGNTDEAGGVFVGASRIDVNGKPVTLVTAVAGSSTLFTAMKDSLGLIQSARNNFKPVTLIKAGTIVGRYQLPWGGNVNAIAARDLKLSSWASGRIDFTSHLKSLPAGARAGQTTGSLIVPGSALNDRISIPVKLSETPPTPSLFWRLLHPM